MLKNEQRIEVNRVASEKTFGQTPHLQSPQKKLDVFSNGKLSYIKQS